MVVQTDCIGRPVLVNKNEPRLPRLYEQQQRATVGASASFGYLAHIMPRYQHMSAVVISGSCPGNAVVAPQAYLLRKEKLQGSFLSGFSFPSLVHLPGLLSPATNSPGDLGYSPDDYVHRGGTHESSLPTVSAQQSHGQGQAQQAGQGGQPASSTTNRSISGRPTTLGSSLPVPPPMDRSDTDDRTCSAQPAHDGGK